MLVVPLVRVLEELETELGGERVRRLDRLVFRRDGVRTADRREDTFGDAVMEIDERLIETKDAVLPVPEGSADERDHDDGRRACTTHTSSIGEFRGGAQGLRILRAPPARPFSGLAVGPRRIVPPRRMSVRARLAALLLLVVGLVAVLVARGPMPQDPAYHLFADTRAACSVPNFGDVVSNLPFLVVGLAGVASVRRRWHGPTRSPGFAVLFVGVALTAFGSAYYHAAPTTPRLVWDRLPMTLGFMGLFAAVLGDRVRPDLERRLVAPFVLVGVLSVLAWALSESAGRGDLRAYVLVQFVPLVTLPFLLLGFEGRTTHGYLLGGALSWYLAAKGLEELDARIFHATGSVVSGHTLKHLAAAVACAHLARYHDRRQVRRRSSEGG